MQLQKYLGDVVGFALTLTVASLMPSPLPIAVVLAIGGLLTRLAGSYIRHRGEHGHTP